MALCDIEWGTLSEDARAFLMRPSIRVCRSQEELKFLSPSEEVRYG